MRRARCGDVLETHVDTPKCRRPAGHSRWHKNRRVLWKPVTGDNVDLVFCWTTRYRRELSDG